jgi:hypothetical protein
MQERQPRSVTCSAPLRPEVHAQSLGRPVFPAEPAGEKGSPLCPLSSSSRSGPSTGAGRITRRGILAAGGVLALSALASGCGGGHGGGGSVEIFALSGRGRRISNAAKIHNANKRFLFAWVADANRAHDGDTSRIVSLVVSQDEVKRLFGPGKLVADLRHLG